MDDSNSDVCELVCEVLAEIGTQKSIPKLTQLAGSEDFFISTEAKRAKKAILEAERAPEEPTSQ